MKIILGSDKSGFPLREALYAHLLAQGHQLTVLGPTDATQAVPFYVVAPLAAEAIQKSEGDCAILICGTGMGMNQVANKFKGIRAACVESEYSARMARIINDSNILCMGAWLIAPEMGIVMADAFLQAQFVNGVEEWRKEWLENARRELLALENQIYASPHHP